MSLGEDNFTLAMAAQCSTDSQPVYVDIEGERRIKGIYLPLRIMKGNVNGLRCSQARNHGFGERNGAVPRDRYEHMDSQCMKPTDGQGEPKRVELLCKGWLKLYLLSYRFAL